MKPGTIVFDSDFVFDDGTSGPKLTIILTDGQRDPFLVVKVTSKGHRFGRTPGAQLAQCFPAFYLPRGTCSFPDDTWVELSKVFEFDPGELAAGIASGRLAIKGALPDSLRRELTQAAADSPDTMGTQRAVLLRFI